ncbi:hypothetical protein LINPERPRIM_LOCUS9478 [Linum perenne]
MKWFQGTADSSLHECLR